MMLFVKLLVISVIIGCAKKPVKVPPKVDSPIEIKTYEIKRPVVKEEPKQVETKAPPNFENVMFEYDSFVPLNTNHLQYLAIYLKENDKTVLLEGHACELGTEYYNLSLGEHRAGSVKDWLLNSGVALNSIEMISYGEERPVSDNLMLNRRVEIKIKE